VSAVEVTDTSGGDGYRLAGIDKTAAPSDSNESDWFVYRIAQGANVITGYRRGELRAVTADLERMVKGLNERRIVNRGRVDLTTKGPALPVTSSPRDAVDALSAAEAPFATD
jgi:hypothetical protein